MRMEQTEPGTAMRSPAETSAARISRHGTPASIRPRTCSAAAVMETGVPGSVPGLEESDVKNIVLFTRAAGVGLPSPTHPADSAAPIDYTPSPSDAHAPRPR